MANAIERKLLDSSGNPTGEAQVLGESLANSHSMDTVITSPPASGARTQAIFGWDTRHQYIPEDPRTWNPQQFFDMDEDRYWDPNFLLVLDFGGWLSVQDRLRMGINGFSQFSITLDQRDEIPVGSGMYEIPESSVHNTWEGFGIYKASLSEYEAHIRTSFEGVGHPTGTLKKFGQIKFNIESSQFWAPGDGVFLPGFTNLKGNCNSAHYPPWNEIKTQRIRCETDGIVRTFAECAAMGEDWWIREMWLTRRVNRFAVMLQVAKEISAQGTIVRYGTAMSQGAPMSYKRDNNSLFIEGWVNVEHVESTNGSGQVIGNGDSSGHVVLNGRSYTLPAGKTFYSNENGGSGYYYEFNGNFSPTDYQDIFVDHDEDKMNYPYIHGKLIRRHYTAEEFGFYENNEAVMINRRADGQAVGIARQTEAIFESSPHVPFPWLQGAGGETPKLFQSPEWQWSSFVSFRFRAGSKAGSLYYSFPIVSPDQVVLPPDNAAWDRWDHEWHTYTALIQARAYLQRLERWFPGSTLIKSAEVRINADGGWLNYDATTAYADGDLSKAKPFGAIRFKKISTGTQVEICFGFPQDQTTSRTDEFRAPGGLDLDGNAFRITYSGGWTRVVSVFIPNGVTNQVFNLGDHGVPSWQPAGYAGRTQFI